MIMDPNNLQFPIYPNHTFDDFVLFPDSDLHPSSSVDWQNSQSDLQFLNPSAVPFNPPDNLDLAFALSPGGESFLLSSSTDSPSAGDPSPTASSGWSPDAEQPHHDHQQADASSPEEESSDPVTKYISQMLMEENMEDKPYLCYDPLALKATEMSLYDVIGEQYHSPSPLSGDPPDISVADYYPPHLNSNSPVPPSADYYDWDSNSNSPPVSAARYYDWESNLNSNPPQPPPVNNAAASDWRPEKAGDRIADDNGMVKSMFSNADSVLQFNRGLEEAKKFLPTPNNLLVDLDSSQEKNQIEESSVSAPRKQRKNNHEREENPELEEERNSKQSAISYEEETELAEMFDKVLLLPEGSHNMCSAMDKLDPIETKPADDEKSPNNSGGRGKKQGKTKKSKANSKTKNETADLRGLLILCAQAVSSSDFRTANELLKQVRQHSSETGDGTQRLAHFFANGLEARLAGNSSMAPNFFYSMASARISAADILKAYRTHLNSCPFKKMSILFANKMIYETAANASTLHVIDFGVMFGFQWPILIQLLAMRPGGPPKLRITGIELPQRGFKPTERIDEAGRRLKKYCERFKVPFEYNPIASQNWETIGLEQFKIRTQGDEVVAVNSLCRLKNLMEESFDSNSPRNAVLGLIRRMNPDIFVQTEINGAYNAPFFVTRFREALFHFSSLFDMFECTLGGGKEDKERAMFEREIYGREAMNVVAAEGAERVERPETYKQWQIRNTRAGFRGLALRKELMEKVRSKMKAWYHKDFVVDEDGNWMLQGWKGRIIYATSCWVPA